MKLIDRFGRQHTYLRISLTDRCNLRCTYCMPENVLFMPDKKLLTANEIYLLTKYFVKNGIRKIRLTGGEPLMRKDFGQILNNLTGLPEELALTTNGYLLDKHISDIRKANLASVNISLDTLSEANFSAITHRNFFKKTLSNIELAVNAGIRVKINTVVIKNFNDNELVDFVSLSKELPIEVRFIEFMPFKSNNWESNKTVFANKMLELIRQNFQVEKQAITKNQIAQRYKLKNGKGSFGIISTLSNPFCDGCNRLRITADGKLKNCLFGLKEYNLKPFLDSEKKLGNIVKRAVDEKHHAHGGLVKFDNKSILEYQKNRSMVAIGG